MRHNIASFVMAFAAAVFLAGCGGSGGGGSPAPAASTPTTPTASVCPDGSAVPAGGTSACAPIGPASTPVLTGLDPVTVASKGLSLPFNGTIDPASVNSQNVKLWLGVADTGTLVAGTPTLSPDGKTVTFTPTQRLAYGASYTMAVAVKDTAGHSSGWTAPFAMAAMQCNNITGISTLAQTTWSNPATYKPVYQDCVAPIGVQVKINQAYNKMQDDTCVMVLGVPLSAECKAYLANGTIVLADTSIVVNSNLVTWAFAIDTFGISQIWLLDTNDPTNAFPAPVVWKTLPSVITYVTGNSTGGLLVYASDGKSYQATVDATNNIALTCVKNC